MTMSFRDSHDDDSDVDDLDGKPVFSNISTVGAHDA